MELAQKFDYIEIVIEESKDIDKLFLDEIRKSLQAHKIIG